MDFEIQRKGVESLLAAIYGAEASLSSILHELGFEQARIHRLEGEALQALLGAFVGAFQRRMTGPAGQDDWFQVVSRRYGLDGAAPRTLDEIAQSRGMDHQELAQLWGTILDHCRARGMQENLKKDLKQLAVQQLAQAGEKPDREHVASLLERLSNLHEAEDAARLDYEAKRQEILKKVQTELDALEVEYQPILDSVKENMEELEKEIRTEVLMHGESVSGGAYRALFTKGRIGWDNKGIEKYAQKHPEVLEFRREGAPIISLRLIGDRD